MFLLGIWDGHDSGAVLLERDKILFAINEERLSRRKLEVKFPAESIKACLDFANTTPKEITEIAISTSDPAKTFSRVFPSSKDKYYAIRRRKLQPTKTNRFIKQLKYKVTELQPNLITNLISKEAVKKQLSPLGFRNYNLNIFDHHYCHAASAAYSSGFKKALVITLDGLGDGLSGSINTFSNNELTVISKISAKSSFGIFYEHVTNLINMRELEDEGKVMALADYSLPIDENKNPMLNFFRVENLNVFTKYKSLEMYNQLRKILWHTPMEQFAFYAQQTVEYHVVKLVEEALQKTGKKNIALSGGLFSNIKINRKIRLLKNCDNCFVFPHMGDGGLALGAAMVRNKKLTGTVKYDLQNLDFGPKFKSDELEIILKRSSLNYEYFESIEERTAELILNGEIVFWFQGKMEYGPRALGNRSILARPDSLEIKDNLNILLKKRVWFQPFCPSMLEEDANEVLEDYDGHPNYHMTMSYMVRKEYQNKLQGIINVDGSCRPQMVNKAIPKFYSLLLKIKEVLGTGVLLNTSFNIHGQPLVCKPQEAIDVFTSSKIKYMILENYLITK